MLTHASVVVENASTRMSPLMRAVRGKEEGGLVTAPDQAGVIFECRVSRRTPGRLRTRVTT